MAYFSPKLFKTVRVFTFLFAFLASSLILFSPHLYADEAKPQNSVSLAWEEFKKLLQLDSQDVRLTWDEFKRLVAQTGTDEKIQYNLQDGMVVMSRKQFKQLLDKMKPPTGDEVEAPHEYLVTKSEYAGRMDKESTDFSVRFYIEVPEKKHRTTYVNIPLLPQSVALRKMTINNQNALVMAEGNWHTLTLAKAGSYVVKADFSVSSPLDKGSQLFDFPIPQTAITMVTLDIPLRDVKADIYGAKHLETVSQGNRTKVSAILSPSTRLQLKVQRALAVSEEKKRGPAKIYAETLNLLSLEDDALRVSSKIKLNILQNKVAAIEAEVPAGFSVLYVLNSSGEEIRNWSTAKKGPMNILSVPLEGLQEGNLWFTIVSEHIFSGEAPEVDFSGFKILTAIRETGYIGAEKKSTAEAEIITAENSDRVDIQELPYELISMSDKPMIFGLRYLHHPFKLALKITKHEELATVNTVIDNASVMSVLLEEGKVVTRVIYTMRNTWKQFLVLKLPEDSEMWSLTVDGKRELPSKNKDGAFLVPLVRSRMEGETIRPFTVEILYFTKSSKFGLAGNRKLPFPTADVVISKVLWSVYLPVDFAFLKFGGNLEKEQIAEGLRPILGQKRVFTYKDVNGYNEVLSNMKSGGKVLSKRNLRLQRDLQSNFRSIGQADSSLTQQLEQEIGFASNIQAVQQQSPMAAGGGLALLKIEVPTTGQLYRFAKTLVEGEDLYITYTYVQEWVRTLVWILLAALGLFILYKIRGVFVAAGKKLSAWVKAQQAFFEALRTPNGLRWTLGLGALVFFFISSFLFVILVLLLLIAWFRPEWLVRSLRKPATSATKKGSSK